MNHSNQHISKATCFRYLELLFLNNKDMVIHLYSLRIKAPSCQYLQMCFTNFKQSFYCPRGLNMVSFEANAQKTMSGSRLGPEG